MIAAEKREERIARRWRLRADLTPGREPRLRRRRSPTHNRIRLRLLVAPPLRMGRHARDVWSGLREQLTRGG